MISNSSQFNPVNQAIGGQSSEQPPVQPEADKITYHVMPKKYLSVSPVTNSSQKLGLLISFLIVFTISGLGFAYYWYRYQPSKQSVATPIALVAPSISTSTQATSTSSLVNENMVSEEDALSVYARYRTETAAKAGITDREAVFRKYATAMTLSKFDELKRALSENESAWLLEFNKYVLSAPSYQNMRLVSSSSDGNFRYFNFDSNTGATGTVRMAKEDDVWKLDSDDWGQWVVIPATPTDNVATTSEPVASTSPGSSSLPDSDGDGLTDLEELLLGTSQTSGDSDADTYGDLAELSKLYNPAGGGRLLANANIKRYKNTANGFSFLHPTAWELSDVTGGDSIILRTQDGQMIQVVSESLDKKLDLDAWYMEQFDVDSIDPKSIYEANAWRAIMHSDESTWYFLDPSGRKRLTFSYNRGGQTSISFPNIFRAMAISVADSGE